MKELQVREWLVGETNLFRLSGPEAVIGEVMRDGTGVLEGLGDKAVISQLTSLSRTLKAVESCQRTQMSVTLSYLHFERSFWLHCW